MWIKIAVQFVLGLLGAFFPALKPPSPDAKAQKAEDEAKGATDLLKAKMEGEKIENRVDADYAANPSKLREPDKFKL